MSKKQPIKNAGKRLATLQTWQPEGRLERTLRRCWLPYRDDPRELIAQAANALVPQWRPLYFMLCCFMRTKPIVRPSLVVGFGWADGIETQVLIHLEEGDVWGFLHYAVNVRRGTLAGVVNAALTDGDNPGGEELNVPTVSESALSEMAVAGAIQ